MRGQCVDCTAPSPDAVRCLNCRAERKRERQARAPRVVPANQKRKHPRRGAEVVVPPEPPKLEPPPQDVLVAFAALEPAQRILLADCYRQRHLHADDVDDTDLAALRSARLVRRDSDPATGRKSNLWFATTSAGAWCASQVIDGGRHV